MTDRPAPSAPAPSTATAARWTEFAAGYPAVKAAYDGLRDACADAGPLDSRTSALIKLAVSVGRGASRTVHRHAKKALRAGATPDELRHVALLALPTIGLPAALDAIKWIEESLAESATRGERGSLAVPARSSAA